ncbi:MAG TPA: hypothetical protein VIJ50_07200 [Solirubrobacteraceae bacterium]
MPSAVSSASLARRGSVSGRDCHALSHRALSPCPAHDEEISRSTTLGSYRDEHGRARELLTLPGHGDSLLVLDRDAATLCDRRLIAHLAADEPRGNAELICSHYLQDAGGRWCRRMCPEDLRASPLTGKADDCRHELTSEYALITGRNGSLYRLSPVQGERCIPQMRWCRVVGQSDDCRLRQASLREVIGAVESYEPIRTLTRHAIRRHGNDPLVSVTRMRSELERLEGSPVVLNRRLREAVIDAVDRCGISMSEIALRCGVVKRDRRGKVSGETSWLARRIGIMPEGGEKAITPWIHSEVLGSIARNGLRISPREVELQ